MAQRPIIELRGIRRSFVAGGQTQEVLKGVDLSIPAGETVSIIGQSGSGKTTLMNLIGLLDKPDQGEYFLDSQLVSALDVDQAALIRNQKIGFVFQSFFLLPRLTAIQNVGLPLWYRELAEKEIHDRSLALLSAVGMEKWRDHYPKQLSGGQQQRVAIARALVGEPGIVLADEPTGALDQRLGQEVLELFIQLNQSRKTTVLIITHDLKVASACALQVKMEEGRILNALKQ